MSPAPRIRTAVLAATMCALLAGPAWARSEVLPNNAIPNSAMTGVRVVVLADPGCNQRFKLELHLADDSPLLADPVARRRYMEQVARWALDRKCKNAEVADVTVSAYSGTLVDQLAFARSEPSVPPSPVKRRLGGQTPPTATAPPTITPADALVTSESELPHSKPAPATSVDPESALRPADRFGPLLLELTFPVCVLLLLLGLHVLSNSKRADVLLELPNTIRAISRVLFPRPVAAPAGVSMAASREIVLVDGDEMTMRFTLPLVRGIFWHRDRAERCWLTHVPVPPGMLARVDANNVSLSPVLDTSRLVTIVDDALGGRISVTAIERSARWQVVENQGIQTRDGYTVRLHLAVHSWVYAPADHPGIERLFEEYLSYRSKVRVWVLGALNDLLGAQDYDYSLRWCDELTERLNALWQEAQIRELGAALAEVVTTSFVALVIKPRHEAEQTRFRQIFSRVTEVENKIKKMEEKSVNLIRGLDQALAGYYGYMGTSLNALSDFRKEPDGEVHSAFRRTLLANTRAIGGNLAKGIDRDFASSLVLEPFLMGKKSLEDNASSYTDACERLAQAVRDLREEQRRTLSVQGQVSVPANGTGSL